MSTRRRIVKNSQDQEKRIAKRLGATRHGGSGNGPVRKNDMHNSKVHVECKMTDGKKQITIKDTDLIDVGQNAAVKMRIPLLAFTLPSGDYYIVAQADAPEEWSE